MRIALIDLSRHKQYREVPEPIRPSYLVPLPRSWDVAYPSAVPAFLPIPIAEFIIMQELDEEGCQVYRQLKPVVF